MRSHRVCLIGTTALSSSRKLVISYNARAGLRHGHGKTGVKNESLIKLTANMPEDLRTGGMWQNPASQSDSRGDVFFTRWGFSQQYGKMKGSLGCLVMKAVSLFLAEPVEFGSLECCGKEKKDAINVVRVKQSGAGRWCFNRSPWPDEHFTCSVLWHISYQRKQWSRVWLNWLAFPSTIYILNDPGRIHSLVKWVPSGLQQTCYINLKTLSWCLHF